MLGVGLAHLLEASLDFPHPLLKRRADLARDVLVVAGGPEATADLISPMEHVLDLGLVLLYLLVVRALFIIVLVDDYLLLLGSALFAFLSQTVRGNDLVFTTWLVLLRHR